MRKFHLRDLRFPLGLFGVLSFLTCCDMVDTSDRPEASIRYVTADGLGVLTVGGGRWDLQVAGGPRTPKINPKWEGGVRLVGAVDSTYSDAFTGDRTLALRVTYIGQIMDGGLERPREMAFLDGGLWAGGVATAAITDSTVGPLNGWYFRREYTDLVPPRPE